MRNTNAHPIVFPTGKTWLYITNYFTDITNFPM